MPISQENVTFRGFGAVGINQPIATLITSISPIGPGLYKVWGSCRHTLYDGVRLIASGANNMIISQTGDFNAEFGPFVIDLVTAANTVLLELDKATGASDTASGNLYVQKIS